MANFVSIFPQENFTAFFAARKEFCHLELTLGASSPKEFFFFERCPFIFVELLGFGRDKILVFFGSFVFLAFVQRSKEDQGSSLMKRAALYCLYTQQLLKISDAAPIDIPPSTGGE